GHPPPTPGDRLVVAANGAVRLLRGRARARANEHRLRRLNYFRPGEKTTTAPRPGERRGTRYASPRPTTTNSGSFKATWSAASRRKLSGPCEGDCRPSDGATASAGAIDRTLSVAPVARPLSAAASSDTHALTTEAK